MANLDRCAGYATRGELGEPRLAMDRPECRFRGTTVSTTRIRVVVDLEIYDGKLAELEAIAKQMVAESQQEPGTLGFQFLLSADRTRCRLVEGYADQAAIAAHFGAPAVHQHIQQIIQVALPTRMEIYGDPGPMVAGMAADFAVEIFTAWEGFDR